MEHLCIGSYIRVLTSCAVTTARKFSFISEQVMLLLCDDDAIEFHYRPKGKKNDVTYSPTNFEKIYSSKQNFLPEIIQMATAKSSHAIERSLRIRILPHIQEEKKKAGILALKNIICKDNTISTDVQIGTINSLKKEELMEKNEFIFSEFLTDVFLFALTKTDNTLYPDFTKSIGKNYCDNYLRYSDTITLYKNTIPIASPSIPKTTIKDFGSVFSHISTRTLSISATHDLQIYALKFDDFEFDYQALQKYLRSNIGYYFFSRAKINDYINEGDVVSVTYDAVDELKQIVSKTGIQPGDKLGEILLYAFLEDVLNAPKLMSAAEIGNFGGIKTSSSSGIHLLSLNTSPPSSQIVLGTSIINGNLCETIDQAFAKAAILRRNKNSERTFIEANIFATAPSKEIRDQMEAILIPKESSAKRPDSAFGFFMGYSLSHVSSNGKTVMQYQDAVLSQIKSDIDCNLDKIEDAISHNGLTGFPLYIYLLPFNDADRDKQRIMNRLLQIGEDTG